MAKRKLPKKTENSPPSLFYPQKIEPTKTFMIPQLTALPINVYSVNIVGEEYRICDNFAHNMWCSSKAGMWGRGLINTKDDQTKAERTGLLGEMAFSKVYGLGLDIEYKKGGKSIDFLSCDNKKIEIKTASKKPKYEAGLVKCIKNLRADIYIFGYVDSDDRENGSATVILVGFDYKENIMKQEKKKGKVGDHLNYELPYHKLIPIECFGGLINERLGK